MNPSRFVILVTSFFLAVLVVACGSDPAPEPATAEATAPPAEQAEEQTAAEPISTAQADNENAAQAQTSEPERLDNLSEDAPPEAEEAQAEEIAFPDDEAIQQHLRERYPQFQEGFAVSDVWAGAGGPVLAVAHSLGFAPYEPPHLVVMLELSDAGIVERGVLELESFPTILEEGALAQVLHGETGGHAWIDADGDADLWFTVNGFTGAHASVFEAVSWNAEDGLRSRFQHFWSIPGDAAFLEDVEGDGVPEIVLELTEPYVFCYACGVRWYERGFMRWDGAGFVPVHAQRLGEDTDVSLRTLVNRSVDLAEAGYWREAAAASAEALELAPDHATVIWNDRIIADMAHGLLGSRDSAFPLLTEVFAGEFEAALDVLRDYPASDLLDLPGWTAEGPADMWQDLIPDYILAVTEPALAYRPTDAAALLLQALARHWAGSGAALVRQDLDAALRAAPATDFFYVEIYNAIVSA